MLYELSYICWNLNRISVLANRLRVSFCPHGKLRKMGLCHHTRMARACAMTLFVLCFPVVSIESFAHRSFRTRHYAGHYPQNMTPSNKMDHFGKPMESLTSISKILFPPIPEQDKEMTMLVQFNPTFIVSEFLIGFSIYVSGQHLPGSPSAAVFPSTRNASSSRRKYVSGKQHAAFAPH